MKCQKCGHVQKHPGQSRGGSVRNPRKGFGTARVLEKALKTRENRGAKNN
jgi:hypothetical protein